MNTQTLLWLSHRINNWAGHIINDRIGSQHELFKSKRLDLNGQKWF